MFACLYLSSICHDEVPAHWVSRDSKMSSIDPVGRRGTWKSLQLHVLGWVSQRNLQSCGDVTRDTILG